MDDTGGQNMRKVRAQEYLKCARDPIYFMQEYVYIVHQEKGLIQFDLFDFQKRTLRDLREYRFNIILKARQMGVTTLLSAYSLWLMLFNENKGVLALSYKQDKAKNIVTKVKRMHANLPSWMKEQLEIDNQLAAVFSNGSKIEAEATTSEAGRSESVSFVIIDEAAFVDNAEDVWGAVKLTLDVGNGNCAVLSCVTDDTYVFTEDGLTRMSEMVEKSKTPPNGPSVIEDGYEVLGRDKKRSGSLFHHNGEVDTKIVRTQHSKLEGSFNHKLFAYAENNGYGWYRLDELQEGDHVPIQYGMGEFGDQDNLDCGEASNKESNIICEDEITPDLAYLFGAYISEGSCHIVENEDGIEVGASFTFTCEDDIISKPCSNLGLNVSCHDGLHRNVSSVSLLRVFEAVGFDISQKSHEKRIPDRLLKMSRENIKAMLQGIFDGDGWSRNDRGHVGFCSTSAELTRQVNLLLNNFGILANRYERPKEYFNKRGDFEYDFNHDTTVLELNAGNSRKFYNSIGFRLDRKQSEKDALPDNPKSGSRDVVPGSLDLVHDMFDAVPFGAWTFENHHGISMRGGLVSKATRYKTDDISREKILDILEVSRDYMDENKVEEVERVASENMKWTKIKDVEEGRAETYDFSLPDKGGSWDHSVVYNGILGHQTPTGVGTWFHESWQKAMQGDEVEKLTHDPEAWDGIGENRFHPIKLHWSLHPGRGQDWRDEQDDTMGEKKAARECFDGDTKIYTDEGLVPIRDVEVGDRVLTHKGRLREVLRTFEKKAETLAFNTSLNKKKSRVTPDHPVLDLDEEWNPFESFGEGDKLSHFPSGNGEYSVCRVNEIEDGGQTTVYNLEVEEDHTYVTEHFVAHNCDCDFSTSGDTVIRQEIIQWYANNAVEEPMEVHRKGKGEVWLWEPPDPDKVYIMASDVARGDGTDYSTFQIYKAREMEQVAEYKGKMPPGDFGDLLTTYGTMFNDALLVIERDSYGWAAMQQVIDRGYPNLLYTSNDLKLVEIDRDAAMSYNDDKVKPGLDTNTNTRGLIISRLQEFMRKRWIRMKSERLTEELRTFIWKNKGTRQKPEHMDGYNDDLIFAAAFACWVRDKALRYRAELQQRSKESLSNIKGNKLAYSPNGGPGDPYNQNMGGESEDLRWLLD